MKVKIIGDIDENMLLNVAESFDNYKKGETVDVEIDSLGGYINIANDIADILLTCKSQGSTINIYNSGDVMSAATIIWLVGDSRKFSPNEGEFLIHQPYYEHTQGNADELIAQAIDLTYTEDELADLYSAFSGEDVKEKILERMKENTPLTTDELVKYNLVTSL